MDACGACWCALGARTSSRCPRGKAGSAPLTAPERPLQRREHVSPRLCSRAGRHPACKTMRGRTDRSRSAHACCRDARDVCSRHGMCRCGVNAARCEAGELGKPAHRACGRRLDEHECLRPRSSRSGLPRCRPAESSICARQQPEQSEVQHFLSLGAFRAHKQIAQGLTGRQGARMVRSDEHAYFASVTIKSDRRRRNARCHCTPVGLDPLEARERPGPER